MKITNPWPPLRADLKRIAEAMYPFSLVMNDLKFIIFGMLAGYILFTVPDQAKDNFINMFGETHLDKIDWVYVLAFWLSVIFWSLHAWAGARTILYLRNYSQFKCSVDGEEKWEVFKKRIILLQKYVPRIFALVPSLIVMNAISSAICFNWFATSYLLTGTTVFIFLTYRTQMFGMTQEESDHRFLVPMTELAWPYKLFLWVTGLLLLCYLLLVIFSIPFSQKLQTMLIIGVSINFWIYVFMWLQYFTWKMRTSLIVLLLIIFYYFSIFNNNHEVRTLGEEPYRAHPSLPDIRVHYDHFLQNGPAKDTIYLIATQGGGIRAAYWTTQVIMELIKQNPKLIQKLYAVSGASGGTVGAAVYIANLKRYGNINSDFFITKSIHDFYDNDFLAPLTAAYLVPDLIQKFLPFTCNFLDRARYLEKSWEAADTSGLFVTSFADMFRDTVTGYNLPLLMINSTWIETGQRTVISPVKISGSGMMVRESYPLLDNWGGDIRLSTAVGMGARFPLLTPGAVVKTKECEVLGTFADGGYVENTGIATAIDLKDMIKERHNSGPNSTDSLVIHLIYIENGDTSGKANPEPLKELYETKTVINGFYNSWDGQDKTTASKVTSYFKEYNELNRCGKERVSIAFTRISLPRQTDTILPLGWVLSAPAKEFMLNATQPAIKIAFTKTEH